MRLRAPALLVATLLLSLAGPQAAQAGWLEPESLKPTGPDVVPQGFEISPREAVRAADRSPEVRRELAAHPRAELRTEVSVPTYLPGPRWEVGYEMGKKRVVEAHVEGRTGRVLEVWTGPQVDWLLARGYEPSVGGKTLNAAHVWLPLCLLFIVPFFDPRRPFRLLHLDLLALLGFGLSQLLLNRGEIDLFVPFAYPFLGYLFVRLLLAGLRPRKPAGPLVPVMPVRILGGALLLLVAFRVALNITDSSVMDVGLASVVGADRITQGHELYTDGDPYGPINYLAYVPFELIFPWNGGWDSVPAAHAAALTFDALTLLGLFLVGTRLRGGNEGRALGLALAFAWAAYPYSTYALQTNTNDGLVAMLLVYSLLVLASPPARGAVLALSAMTKFVPLGLIPLLAAGPGDRRPASVIRFAATFLAVAATAVLVYLPDGGLAEFYETTLGYQSGRDSPFTPWGLYPSLGPVRSVAIVLAALLALALFFKPRRRDLRQVAALGAALVVAAELVAPHWFFLYLVWFGPLALVALLGAHEQISRASGRIAGSTRARSA